MASVTRTLIRTWIALFVLTLGASGSLARADVVTLVLTGPISQATPETPLGLANGDRVRLELTFDRELVMGRTPVLVSVPFDKSAPPAAAGLGIRLEIGGLVFTERDDEEFTRREGGTPFLSFSPQTGPVFLEYSVPFTDAGRSFRLAVGLDRLDIFLSDAGERSAGAVVFDQRIDPPPPPTPVLRDGSVLLVDDQRRLESRCFDPESLPPPPTLILPFVPFGPFSRSGLTCFGASQTSTVAPKLLQGSGSAAATPREIDTPPRPTVGSSASHYDVSFRLEAAASFGLSGMLSKDCNNFTGGQPFLTATDFQTPFVALTRADGTVVFRRALVDLADPALLADPEFITFGGLATGSFSGTGDLPPGDYRIEVVADATGRTCRFGMSGAWSFALALSDAAPPPPPPDADRDGVPDAKDNCPFAPNADQRDSGGLGGAPADGIGDACQCGDVTGDGVVSVLDALRLLGVRSRPPAPLPTATCDVDGDGMCGRDDANAVLRALLRRQPLAQRCAAAVGPAGGS